MNQIICAVCMKPAVKIELNERVCHQCLADAKLGGLVRNFEKQVSPFLGIACRTLRKAMYHWEVVDEDNCGIRRVLAEEPTPEEALEAAGVKA